ncbi:MAG: hypothetical protein ABIG37_01095 [Nanoarchaeota archaeon]|nr:hypothetical protein [Nanoarchaeota archaeon]
MKKREKVNEPSNKVYHFGRALVGLCFLISLIYLNSYLSYDFYKALVGSFLIAVVVRSLYKMLILNETDF